MAPCSFCCRNYDTESRDEPTCRTACGEIDWRFTLNTPRATLCDLVSKLRPGSAHDPVVMGSDVIMAFAGIQANQPNVDNVSSSAGVGDHPRFLHFAGNFCDTGSSH